MNIKHWVTYWMYPYGIESKMMKRESIGCINEKDAEEWKETMEKDTEVFNVHIERSD